MYPYPRVCVSARPSEYACNVEHDFTYHNLPRSEVVVRIARAPTVTWIVAASGQLVQHTAAVRHGCHNGELGLRTFVWGRTPASTTTRIVVASSLSVILRPGPLPIIRIPVAPVCFRWRVARVRSRRRIASPVRRTRARTTSRRRRVSRTRPGGHVQRRKLREGKEQAVIRGQIRVCKGEEASMMDDRPLRIAKRRRALWSHTC